MIANVCFVVIGTMQIIICGFPDCHAQAANAPPVPWLQGKTKKCGQLKTQFGAILRLLINAFAVFFFLLFRFWI